MVTLTLLITKGNTFEEKYKLIVIAFCPKW